MNRAKTHRSILCTTIAGLCVATAVVAACSGDDVHEENLVRITAASKGLPTTIWQSGTVQYAVSVIYPLEEIAFDLDVELAPNGDDRHIAVHYDDGNEQLTWITQVDNRGRHLEGAAGRNAARPLLAAIPGNPGQAQVASEWSYPVPQFSAEEVPTAKLWDILHQRVTDMWDFSGIALMRQVITIHQYGETSRGGQIDAGITGVGVVDVAIGPWGAVPTRSVRYFWHEGLPSDARPTLAEAQEQADWRVVHCATGATDVPGLPGSLVRMLNTVYPASDETPTPDEFTTCAP